jgi:hypothetical protein
MDDDPVARLTQLLFASTVGALATAVSFAAFVTPALALGALESPTTGGAVLTAVVAMAYHHSVTEVTSEPRRGPTDLTPLADRLLTVLTFAYFNLLTGVAGAIAMVVGPAFGAAAGVGYVFLDLELDERGIPLGLSAFASISVALIDRYASVSADADGDQHPSWRDFRPPRPGAT